MHSFQLVQCQTPDKLIHQGIYSESPSATRGIIWVHGLTGSFYGNVDLVNALANQALANTISFVSFNTRGHDCISGIRKIDTSIPKGYTHVMGGAGYEQFEESIYDIQGAIAFLQERGVRDVVLVGHSTGANKVSYFQALERSSVVSGVVLLSPLSDKYGIHDKDQLSEHISQMAGLVEKGQGDALIGDIMYFPLTPRRFLSLVTQGPEDQFGYGENPPQLPYFSQIRGPVLVMMGEKDEYADRPVKSILKVFDTHASSFNYTSELVVDALHNFVNNEVYVAQRIVQWSSLL
jgi:pimeloyl-ACP methyl ester carboxylesterase